MPWKRPMVGFMVKWGRLPEPSLTRGRGTTLAVSYPVNAVTDSSFALIAIHRALHRNVAVDMNQ